MRFLACGLVEGSRVVGFMRVLVALVLLAVVVFCGLGFLATFEPVEGAMVWRVGYGAGVVACLYGAWRVFRRG